MSQLCQRHQGGGRRAQIKGRSGPRYQETESPALCRAFLCLPIGHLMSALRPKADIRMVES